LSLGYTSTTPEEDRYMMTRSELLDHITQTLGGRAAEEIVFSDVTTGAANDLEQVTELARRMVTEFGMSDELGPLQYGKKHGPIFLARDLAEERNYSEEVARLIDAEVRRIVDECYGRAKTILTENRDRLDALAEALLEHETLDAAAVKAVVETGRMPEQAEAAEAAPTEPEAAEAPAPPKAVAKAPAMPPPVPEAGV
jgi:cell division protease FtsH